MSCGFESHPGYRYFSLIRCSAMHANCVAHVVMAKYIVVVNIAVVTETLYSGAPLRPQSLSAGFIVFEMPLHWISIDISPHPI